MAGSIKGKDGSGIATSTNPFPVELSTNDKPVSVQNPFQVDGDSVYAKDVWVEESITTNWTDEDGTGLDVAVIPFTNLHTRMHNATGDNPKTVMFHFNRTINAHQVGLGSIGAGESFSNVKIILLGSGNVERTVLDDSGDNTKHNSENYEFEPQLFNALKIEFHTADTVCISNCTIQKSIEVESFIKLQKPDGTIVNAQGTTKGNIKGSIEEFDPTFYDKPLPIMKGFDIPKYDEIVLGYTGSDLTSMIYKLLTVTVATLTLSYVSGQLTGVVQS